MHLKRKFKQRLLTECFLNQKVVRACQAYFPKTRSLTVNLSSNGFLGNIPARHEQTLMKEKTWHSLKNLRNFIEGAFSLKKIKIE